MAIMEFILQSNAFIINKNSEHVAPGYRLIVDREFACKMLRRYALHTTSSCVVMSALASTALLITDSRSSSYSK